MKKFVIILAALVLVVSIITVSLSLPPAERCFCTSAPMG